MIKKIGAAPVIGISESAFPHVEPERALHGIDMRVLSISEQVALPRNDPHYLRLVRLDGTPPAQPKSPGEMNPLDPALQDRFKAEALARDILKRLERRDLEESKDEAAKLAVAAFWSKETQDARLREFLARGRFYETVFAAHALRTLLHSKEFSQLLNPETPGPSRARLLAELSTAVSQALASQPAHARENLFTSWRQEVNHKVGDAQTAQRVALGGPAVDSLNTMIAGMDMMRRYSGKGS